VRVKRLTTSFVSVLVTNNTSGHNTNSRALGFSLTTVLFSLLTHRSFSLTVGQERARVSPVSQQDRGRVEVAAEKHSSPVQKDGM
jgi:hypothetical protein